MCIGVRGTRDVFPLSPVFRVRIYLCVCVYTSLDLKDVRMLSATTGPVKLLKDESHGATTASSFPSFLLLSLKYSRRGFGETFSKKFASKNCPFLSLEFSSRSIIKRRRCYLNCSFFLSLSIDSSYHLFPFLVIQIHLCVDDRSKGRRNK